MNDIAIRCVDLHKRYQVYPRAADLVLDRLGLGAIVRARRGPLATFDAVRGIDIEVRRGEKVGIVGRNGAGKSTLLKLISGAVTGNFLPSSGRVEVNGQVQALMFAGVSLVPELTGLDNIKSSLVYNGLSREQLSRAVEDVISFVDLGEYLHQPVVSYSLGMASRLEFSIATAVHPDILIIDEVMGAGDAYFAIKSARRMQSLIDSGATLLFVSHSPQQILQFCDRAIWIDNGRVVADGPAPEIVARYGNSVGADGADTSGDGLEWRPFDPAIPREVTSPFVVGAVSAAEGFAANAGETVVLPSGRSAIRRPAEGGAKITDVRVFARSAQKNAIVVAPDNGIRIEADIDGSASAVCVLELYTSSGVAVFRMTSPIQQSKAEFLLSPMVLGARGYVGSLRLLSDAADEKRPNDVLSHVVYLPVSNTTDTDPPLLHYPAQWRFGDGGWYPARLSSSM